MSLIRQTFFLLCLGMIAASGHAQTAGTPASDAITINPAQTWGTWEGWGTSLCWMGNVFGNRDDLADFLFTTRTTTFGGKPVLGLGMTIARYNAGACSWNEFDGRKMVLSKTIKRFRQIPGFWLDGKNSDPSSASWDWNADANQRALLLKAKQRGADRFELFSNSPPWWMCANDNPSGAAKGENDNLPERNYPAFATYLTTVAKVARDNWGVTFTSIEPFNEPATPYWFSDGKQEGCHFSRSSQPKFLPLLRAELDRQGLSTLLLAASDETNSDSAVATWKSFPPALKAIVAQVNVHGYQYAKGDRAALHRLVVQEDGKKLWMSEYGKKDGGGIELARNLHRDFSRLHPTAWCYWQPTDGGGWGLLSADMVNATIVAPETNAYVLAQYSRHIRPGMALLDSGDASTVAAYDARQHKLVLVIFNDGPARTITCNLTAFTVGDVPVPRFITSPHATARYERLPDLHVSARLLNCPLPADSIQTVEINPVLIP